MRFVMSVVFLLTCGPLWGHELTPAYPKLEPSYVDGIYRAKLTLFNRRQEVEYYQIDVFDEKWKKIPFAVQSRLLQVKYLERKTFEVYVRKQDVKRVTYLCTESKLTKEKQTATIIASRICSKVK